LFRRKAPEGAAQNQTALLNNARMPHKFSGRLSYGQGKLILLRLRPGSSGLFHVNRRGRRDRFGKRRRLSSLIKQLSSALRSPEFQQFRMRHPVTAPQSGCLQGAVQYGPAQGSGVAAQKPGYFNQRVGGFMHVVYSATSFLALKFHLCQLYRTKLIYSGFNAYSARFISIERFDAFWRV
jgi:hypothetical protein